MIYPNITYPGMAVFKCQPDEQSIRGASTESYEAVASSPQNVPIPRGGGCDDVGHLQGMFLDVSEIATFC
jgi:hypothetical protein